MKRRTIFLLGAGISVEAPASLPAALGLAEQIISRITPNVLVRKKLLSLFDVSRREAAHRGDFLRFETFIEVLQEHGDPDLTILDFFRELHHPNALHLTLAREAIRGAVLITTNFDSFLEDAIRFLGREPCTICREHEFRNWRKSVARGQVPVFKIHGSVVRWRGHKTRVAKDSVIATIASLTNSVNGMRLPKHKECFLQQALQNAELVVAGYSAADELDVVPSLIRSKPAAVTWLEFEPRHSAAKDETSTTMAAIASKPEAARNGKDQLFAAWHSSTGTRFRHLRVHTRKYLAARYGLPFTPVHPDPGMSSSVKLNQHLLLWGQKFANAADRAEVIGEIFFRMGHYQDSAAWFERGLRLAKGDKQREPMLTLFLVRVLMERAEYSKAMAFLKGLSPTVLRKQPPGRQARYLHHLGMAHYKQREFRKAMSCYSRALKLTEAHDPQGTQAIIIHDIGIIWQERGDYARAAQCFAKSIPLSRKAGDARHVAWSEYHLAIVSFMKADLVEARSAMEEALAHAHALNDLSHVSNCGHGLALIEFQEGRLTDALRRTRSCIRQGIAAGQREWTGMDWELLGVCFWEAGRFTRAGKCFRLAERVLKAVHDEDTLSELYAFWAEMLVDVGRVKEASAKASVSLTLAEKGRLPEFVSRSLFVSGMTAYLEGNQVQGIKSMRSGLRLGLKTPVIALDLAYAAAKRRLAGKSTRVCTLPFLKWAEKVYQSIHNAKRATALSLAIADWNSL